MIPYMLFPWGMPDVELDAMLVRVHALESPDMKERERERDTDICM